MGLLEYFFKKLLITEFVKTDKAQLFLKKTYLSWKKYWIHIFLFFSMILIC